MSIDDTTGSTVPAEDDVPVPPSTTTAPPPPPGGAPAPNADAAHEHLSAWWWVLGVLLTLLAAATIGLFVLSATTVGVDSYILAPGSATDTAPAISVSGAEAFSPDSRIAFTTVSIRRDVTIYEWLRAKWDGVQELVPPEQIDGNRTTEETRQVTQFQMDQSQSTATIVALNYLGYEIVPEVDGAFVIQTVEGSPAAEALRLGDLIVQVDDVEIRSSEDLGVAIRERQPGDTVEVQLKRSAAEQGGSGADPNAIDITQSITLAVHPEVEGAGFLGVQIQTPVRADAPFDVEIDVGRVRGPSAGLAFSLSILDVVTEGELTGGVDIATTGTIDQFGNIGPVGGVPQKTEAAIDADIEVFLVPPREFVTAYEVADGRMDIRCVQTFTDAVIALAEFGGNGLDLAEEFGVPTPELSPNPVDPDDGFLSCAEAIAEAGAEL